MCDEHMSPECPPKCWGFFGHLHLLVGAGLDSGFLIQTSSLCLQNIETKLVKNDLHHLYGVTQLGENGF